MSRTIYWEGYSQSWIEALNVSNDHNSCGNGGHIEPAAGDVISWFFSSLGWMIPTGFRGNTTHAMDSDRNHTTLIAAPARREVIDTSKTESYQAIVKAAIDAGFCEHHIVIGVREDIPVVLLPQGNTEALNRFEAAGNWRIGPNDFHFWTVIYTPTPIPPTDWAKFKEPIGDTAPATKLQRAMIGTCWGSGDATTWAYEQEDVYDEAHADFMEYPDYPKPTLYVDIGEGWRMHHPNNPPYAGGHDMDRIFREAKEAGKIYLIPQGATKRLTPPVN